MEEKDREKKRDEDSGKKEKDRERSRALAVHITLLTIRGQCHRVRPAAPLHFTWLHLAPPLRFSPTLRLLVLPPSRPAVFSPGCIPPTPPPPVRRHPPPHSPCTPLFSPFRAHERDSAVMPLPSSSFYPTAASSPSLSAAPLARASTSPTLPPFSSCSCSLFLLGRPHRAFSSTVRVREHGESASSYRIVSSPSIRFSLLLPR